MVTASVIKNYFGKYSAFVATLALSTSFLSSAALADEPTAQQLAAKLAAETAFQNAYGLKGQPEEAYSLAIVKSEQKRQMFNLAAHMASELGALSVFHDAISDIFNLNYPILEDFRAVARNRDEGNQEFYVGSVSMDAGHQAWALEQYDAAVTAYTAAIPSLNSATSKYEQALFTANESLLPRIETQYNCYYNWYMYFMQFYM